MKNNEVVRIAIAETSVIIRGQPLARGDRNPVRRQHERGGLRERPRPAERRRHGHFGQLPAVLYRRR